MIRILLAGNEYLLRQALRLRLAAEPDMDIIGQVADLEVVPALATLLRPDAVVIDSGRNSLSFQRLSRTLDDPFCDLALVILHEPGSSQCQADGRGRTVRLCQDCPDTDLIQAIRHVARRQPLLGSLPDETL